MTAQSNSVDNYLTARKALEEERLEAVRRIEAIDKVLSETSVVSSGRKRGPSAGTIKKKRKRGRKSMSPEVREKLGKSLRAAWKKRRAVGKKSVS